MVVRDHPALSLSRQCRLLALGRSSLYYEPTGESAETLALMRRIDELFLKYPFYGARRMALHLRREGVRIGRRRAGRLMRLMGLQALDRTQPMLPMRPGQVERRTHDYKRSGTTTLFAALDTATGAVIGTCKKRHRAREFRTFLDEVESAVPADLDIHVVMDNASSHKTKLIQDWFAKRPRWHRHFTPTSASWINQVERFFALLTERQIKRGAHRSTAELETAIGRYIETYNRNPRPFRWTRSADDILASIERFCQRILSAQAKVE